MLALLTPAGAGGETAEETARKVIELQREVDRLKSGQGQHTIRCEACTQTEGRRQHEGAKVVDRETGIGEAPATAVKVFWATKEEIKAKTGGAEVDAGTVVELARTSGILLDGIRVEEKTTTQWFLVVGEGKDAKEAERCLTAMAERVVREAKKEVAMIRGYNWKEVAKCLRGLQSMKGVTVTGHPDGRATWSQIAASGPTGAKQTGPRKSRREALIIPAKAAEYSQVLQGVRRDLEGAQVCASAIRKTKAGDILVEAKGAEDANKIRTALAGRDTRAAGGTSQILVRGLDAMATKEEVATAVKDAAGEGRGMAEVVALWQTAGDTRAARVGLPKEWGTKLIKARSIRVGPVWARVKAPEEDRCYRCWEEGHRAAGCKGPNRADRCYRCGVQGHRAGDCDRAEACLNCGDEGHRTGAARCNGGSAGRETNGANNKEGNFPRPDTRGGKE